MLIYDLLLKLEGLKALCGGGMIDDHISTVLFPTHDTSEKRSRLSRIKSAELPLLLEHQILLTEEFNARITRYVRPASGATSGPLRPEDWARPTHEFFGVIAAHLGDDSPANLDRVHAGILEAILNFAKNREADDALLVDRHFDTESERFRIPESAEPVDPFDLPPARLSPREPMTARLHREVSRTAMRAWLFYVRNPDVRAPVESPGRVWDQQLSELVFWHQGGHFELPGRFIGDLPGFPTPTRNLCGAITAFLLVEPLDSPAVETLLAKPNPTWDRNSAPSFEGFAHMITCWMRLFQTGNTKKQEKGDLPYGPPKLFVRRYQVANGRASLAV
jgi:hypothetical protein